MPFGRQSSRRLKSGEMRASGNGKESDTFVFQPFSQRFQTHEEGNGRQFGQGQAEKKIFRQVPHCPRRGGESPKQNRHGQVNEEQHRAMSGGKGGMPITVGALIGSLHKDQPQRISPGFAMRTGRQTLFPSRTPARPARRIRPQIFHAHFSKGQNRIDWRPVKTFPMQAGSRAR